MNLLGKLGLDRNMSLDEALSHPIVIEYQKGVYRKRIERSSQPVPISGDGGEPSVKAVPGVVGDVKGHELHPDADGYRIMGQNFLEQVIPQVFPA